MTTNGKIHSALVAVMRDVEAIGKDRKNEKQNYKFRGIDDVYNALNPLLSKHGIFTVPEVIDHKREERQTHNGGLLLYSVVTMRYTFFAEDGSSVQAVVIGEGMDSGDKATNKAMAVAHKYALLQVFAVPTEDAKDPENEHHEVVRKSAPANPGRITEPEARAAVADGQSSAHGAVDVSAPIPPPEPPITDAQAKIIDGLNDAVINAQTIDELKTIYDQLTVAHKEGHVRRDVFDAIKGRLTAKKKEITKQQKEAA